MVEAVAEDYGLSEEDRRQLQLKIRQVREGGKYKRRHLNQTLFDDLLHQ